MITRFKFMFEISVQNNEWTTVKLLPDSAAITQTSISKSSDTESSTGHTLVLLLFFVTSVQTALLMALS